MPRGEGAENPAAPERTAGPSAGFSLPEALAGIAIFALLVSVSVPILAETVARERLHAAGLETALTLRGLRQLSVSRRVGLGLRFIRTGDRWSYSLYEDGNGNGIRTLDILSGRDPLLRGPVDPGATHEGVRFGLPQAPVPEATPQPQTQQPAKPATP